MHGMRSALINACTLTGEVLRGRPSAVLSDLGVPLPRGARLPVKTHALMHTKCLYVNAWDAVSAYDFACIDRRRRSLTGDDPRLHLGVPVEMRALVHTNCLYANAWDAISAYDFACIDRRARCGKNEWSPAAAEGDSTPRVRGNGIP